MVMVVMRMIWQIDFSKCGEHDYCGMKIVIVDATEVYAKLMKSIYDFQVLGHFLSSTGFQLCIHGMNGGRRSGHQQSEMEKCSNVSLCAVAGPFVRRIIVKELGCPEKFIVHCDPKEDFGK